MGLIFVKIVFKRTKGEEIKLTDDDLDDIDNGDDGKMADDDGDEDEDEGVICHTIIQQRHFGDVSCCSPNKRPITVMTQQPYSLQADRYLTNIKTILKENHFLPTIMIMIFIIY